MSTSKSHVQVLLVEDEPITALELKQRLIRLGYPVVGIARSAPEALAFAATTRPDLVMVDVCLQDQMSGIEVAARLRSEFDLPIVFLVAPTDREQLSQAKLLCPFDYIFKPLDGADLETVINLALDRHQVQVQMRRSLVQVQAESQQRSQALSLLSHELRTPLNVIQLALEMLQGQGVTPDRRQRCMERARTSVEMMTQLLEELLVLNEVQSGQLHYRPCPLDVVDFCQTVVEALQGLAVPPQQIHLRTHQYQQVGLLNLDKKLLWHILSNLLSNALKYSPAGGSVDLTLIQQPDRLLFQVQDQGIGIPPSEQADLFDTLFYRCSNVGQIPGTGLGLPIIKRCVELHQGSIQVESRIDRGSTFTVSVALADTSDMLI
jgi:signal transduction histidine kinase